MAAATGASHAPLIIPNSQSCSRLETFRVSLAFEKAPRSPEVGD